MKKERKEELYIDSMIIKRMKDTSYLFRYAGMISGIGNAESLRSNIPNQDNSVNLS